MFQLVYACVARPHLYFHAKIFLITVAISIACEENFSVFTLAFNRLYSLDIGSLESPKSTQCSVRTSLVFVHSV